MSMDRWIRGLILPLVGVSINIFIAACWRLSGGFTGYFDSLLGGLDVPCHPIIVGKTVEVSLESVLVYA